MRDPKRIPELLKRLQAVWEEHPYMRLGQLIENVFPNTETDFISGWHLECEDYIKEIESFYSKNPDYRRFGPPRNIRKLRD